MKTVNRFDVSKIPFHSIVFTVSSDDICCDWDRIYYIENLNIECKVDYDSYLIIDGSHCSCYDFEDTEWTATEYTFGEFKKLVEGWIENGWKTEKRIGALIKQYHSAYWNE